MSLEVDCLYLFKCPHVATNFMPEKVKSNKTANKWAFYFIFGCYSLIAWTQEYGSSYKNKNNELLHKTNSHDNIICCCSLFRIESMIVVYGCTDGQHYLRCQSYSVC